MMQSPIITGHAVLRYLERNEDMDIERIRRSLAEQAMNDPRTRKGIDEFGDARFNIKKGEGIIFCMKGGAMTTTYPIRKKRRKSSNRRKGNEQKYPHRRFESTE